MGVLRRSAPTLALPRNTGGGDKREDLCAKANAVIFGGLSLEDN
jgi:hypothetical protein